MFFSCVDICFEITHEFARNLPKVGYVGFVDGYILLHSGWLPGANAAGG